MVMAHLYALYVIIPMYLVPPPGPARNYYHITDDIPCAGIPFPVLHNGEFECCSPAWCSCGLGLRTQRNWPVSRVGQRSCAKPIQAERTKVVGGLGATGEREDPRRLRSRGCAPSTVSREGLSRLFQLQGLQASLGWWPRPSRLCLRLRVASPLGLRLLFCLFSGHGHWTQGHPDPG